MSVWKAFERAAPGSVTFDGDPRQRCRSPRRRTHARSRCAGCRDVEDRSRRHRGTCGSPALARTPHRVKSHVAELAGAAPASWSSISAGQPPSFRRRARAGAPVRRQGHARGSRNQRWSEETITAGSNDGSIAAPAVLLIDTGTSGAAELFASALTGNQRADLIGEHTIGRAAQQKLIKLPDGAGLWLSTSRFLTPSGAQLHEKGLGPTVAVEEPDVAEFGGQPPPGDPILEKALERLAEKKAA